VADHTKIEWADATINAVNGCSVHSPGCTNCYAMAVGARNLPGHPSTGLTKLVNGHHVWTGEVHLSEKALLQPLRWKKPRRIFWNAHGDLFHENVPDEWIDRVFAVCALTPQHTHMILTKRSGRMREYFNDFAVSPYGFLTHGGREPTSYGGPEMHVANQDRWPIPNVWLGVSVEDQTRADQRIPDLLATPAAVRFISAEPLLRPVDLMQYLHDSDCGMVDPNWPIDMTDFCTCSEPREVSLDWVIVGGESGPGARPMHPEWARGLRDQCAAAGVAFLHKQNGEFAPGEIAGGFLNPEKAARGMSYFNERWDECWSEPDGHCDDEPDVYRIGKKRAGRLLDGREWNEVPHA
jgi:protein gp37